MKALTLQQKLKSLFLVTTAGVGTYCIISIAKNNENFYKNTVMPIVHLLDAEKSHKLAVFIAKHRLMPKSTFKDPENLKCHLFGREFSNPIGMAAGFDKDGEAVSGLGDLGFGFVEVGSVTPFPQPGNDKPRVFRLSEDRAVINRYGFNSQGHDAVRENLNHRKNDSIVLGINLGKNKNSLDGVGDYVVGVEKLGELGDYLVINVSSPNTPNLRALQNEKELKILLKKTIAARDSLVRKPPIVLKLAPDLTLTEMKEIANVITQKDTKIDALIVSNTTVARPEFLKNAAKSETGGLSGQPLGDNSTKMIAEMYRLTGGKIPIIGCGGVFTGEDAYREIQAGASAVQIYTSLVYEGPPIVTKIKRELSLLLERDGYRNVAEAVGTTVK